MPILTTADTIRILVATDNHVGYNERDATRSKDSWQTFHEIMCLAKDRDVDMVLLAGDLFHDNKPSRQSMYQVMRSLRMNCYGEKPCELEMLSDGSETFGGTFNHVNYEDQNINVAIPVFSIHGNHDDPSGEGHYAALDVLHVSGLINYYGRTPQSDNIHIKPVLLQKGRTKLAMYGLSNVRDERLFRTFRDGKVKFFQPNTQKSDWFNLMSVHQNHHAHTDTGYLPENFLPEFMDLIIWGHEHECLIEPRYNSEMTFHVMQPGSSVATSLMPGEAVAKHVAILSITGKEFKSEPVRLKTVRPFVMKEVILAEEPGMVALAKREDNRSKITQHLVGIVEGMIKQANAEWLRAQDGKDSEQSTEPPKPLIRLRVEYSAPAGGKFDCENPQRFSNRFVGKVANVNDVIQFHRKKPVSRRAKDNIELPHVSVLAQMTLDTVKVERLVREFLTAQSLTILPQNSFGDAVAQFVDKDDKHAMEMFVEESLTSQIKHLMQVDEADEEVIAEAMDQYRSEMEAVFSAGHLKRAKKRKLKPKPDHWDSDLDGAWEDQPGAFAISDDEVGQDKDEDLASVPPKPPVVRGKAKGASASTRKHEASKKPAAVTSVVRGKKSVIQESESDESDVVMIEDEDMDEQHAEEQEGKEERSRPSKTARTAAARRPERKTTSKTNVQPAKSPLTKAVSSTRQTRLEFSQAVSHATRPSTRAKKLAESSEDEVSDDDAFAPPPSAAKFRGKRARP